MMYEDGGKTLDKGQGRKAKENKAVVWVILVVVGLIGCVVLLLTLPVGSAMLSGFFQAFRSGSTSTGEVEERRQVTAASSAPGNKTSTVYTRELPPKDVEDDRELETEPPLTGQNRSKSQRPGRTIEFKLAVLHSGGYVPEDHPYVGEAKRLLDSIEPKVKQNREQIADMSVKGWQMLNEDGKQTSLFELMRAGNDSIPDDLGFEMDYAEIIVLLVLMITEK